MIVGQDVLIGDRISRNLARRLEPRTCCCEPSRLGSHSQLSSDKPYHAFLAADSQQRCSPSVTKQTPSVVVAGPNSGTGRTNFARLEQGHQKAGAEAKVVRSEGIRRNSEGLWDVDETVLTVCSSRIVICKTVCDEKAVHCNTLSCLPRWHPCGPNPGFVSRRGNLRIETPSPIKVTTLDCLSGPSSVFDTLFRIVAQPRYNKFHPQYLTKYSNRRRYQILYESHRFLELLNTDTMPTGMRVGSAMVNVPNLLKISSAYNAAFHR